MVRTTTDQGDLFARESKGLFGFSHREWSEMADYE